MYSVEGGSPQDPAPSRFTHQNSIGGNPMDFYSMEALEILGDAAAEVEEWMLFEADMATDPYAK